MQNKWIHIIGIAGVTTSAVALMYKNLGWKVTGSDKGFYPPISDFLKTHKIDFKPNYKADRLTDANGNHPTFVLMQGLKGDSNPEVIEAKKLNIQIVNYTDIIAEHVINKDNSIVVAGTYGKTTTTSLLVNIFLAANQNISWMFGGISSNSILPIKSKTDKTKYSIVEGDEYIISLQDRNPKFSKYQPTHLLLTSCKWDHTDIYKSENEYLEVFASLIRQLPEHGLLVVNANDKNCVKLAKESSNKKVYYSSNLSESHIKPDWYLLKESKPLMTLVKQTDTTEIIPFQTTVLGKFNLENILAATALSSTLGVRKEYIQQGLEDFKGIKRRLEKVYEDAKCVLIDDFASSPAKVIGSLSAIKQEYPSSKILVIYEPNTGSRTTEAISTYKDAFILADKVIFPRFTKLPASDLKHIDEDDLARQLKNYGNDIQVIPDDETLLKFISEYKSNNKNHTVIAFMGSHGFRNMIVQVKNNLNNAS